MNKKMEAKQRRGKAAGPTEEADRTDSPKLKANVFPAEDVLITGEQMGDVYTSPQTAGEDSAVLFMPNNEAKEEEGEDEVEEAEGEEEEEEGGEYKTTNLDALLAAWWKYKRENKQKKKRRKLLNIYRDENYWNDGRYTDEEDFNYCES